MGCPRCCRPVFSPVHDVNTPVVAGLTCVTSIFGIWYLFWGQCFNLSEGHRASQETVPEHGTLLKNWAAGAGSETQASGGAAHDAHSALDSIVPLEAAAALR